MAATSSSFVGLLAAPTSVYYGGIQPSQPPNSKGPPSPPCVVCVSTAILWSPGCLWRRARIAARSCRICSPRAVTKCITERTSLSSCSCGPVCGLAGFLVRLLQAQPHLLGAQNPAGPLRRAAPRHLVAPAPLLPPIRGRASRGWFGLWLTQMHMRSNSYFPRFSA